MLPTQLKWSRYVYFNKTGAFLEFWSALSINNTNNIEDLTYG